MWHLTSTTLQAEEACYGNNIIVVFYFYRIMQDSLYSCWLLLDDRGLIPGKNKFFPYS
jgi:hypothetical protein